MIQRRRTAFFGVLLALMLVILPKFNLVTQESLPETIEFSDEIITFKQSSGIVLRVSRPFRRFQKWDTEHTGDSWFSIALEFTNNTDLFISAINFFPPKLILKNFLVSLSLLK